MAVYLRLLGELDANNQHLSEQISEIDLTDPEDARVLMPEQGADILAHFGEDHFLERYQRYKAHIAEWRQQYPKLAAVDLRYDQQVVLEMAHGANAVEATAGVDSASDSKEASPSATDVAEKAKPVAGVNAAPDADGKPALNSSAVATPTATAQNTKDRLANKDKLASKDKVANKDRLAPKERLSKDRIAKERAAQQRAAKEKKKRAEAQRAALNFNKAKSAPTARAVSVAGQGQ
jgi:cell division protein FtsQ